MDPGSAAQTFWLPPVWSPEWGFHWETVFNYCLGLFLFGGPLKGIVNGVFDWLRTAVNKIHLTIPLPFGHSYYLDMAQVTWDDELIETFRSRTLSLVSSRENEAKRVKLRYKPQLEAANTPEEREEILQKCYEELEDVTTATVNDFKEIYPELWRSAMSQFQDPEKVVKFLKTKIKASVVERKNGSTHHVSMTKAIEATNTGDGGQRKETANA